VPKPSVTMSAAQTSESSEYEHGLVFIVDLFDFTRSKEELKDNCMVHVKSWKSSSFLSL
jgi:hypothetical protein